MQEPIIKVVEVSAIAMEEGLGTVTLSEHTLSLNGTSVSWSRLEEQAPGGGGFLCFGSRSSSSESSVELSDLLGCSVQDSPPRLVLHAFPRSKGAGSARRQHDYELPCAFLEQAKSAASSIRAALGQSAPRKMLVLVNPFGGGGKAPRVWRTLQPLLEMGGVECEVVTTTHAGHAREYVASLSLGVHSAIVTVSGDGLINEVLNGLLSRADAAEAIAALPLAPAPGGTGNGLHKSICHRAGEAHDLIATAFVISKGSACRLDAWQYLTPASGDGATAEEHVMWSVLSFSWGVVADVDLESEVLRWCGPLRLTMYALMRIASLRRYSGTLEYQDAASGEWVRIEGSDWVGFWACNVAYMTQTDYAAPQAEFDNGHLDVLVLKGSTRAQTLSMFLAMEEGKHIGGAGLSLVKAKAFRFYPQPRTPSKPGLLDVDGELVEPYGPIECRPHPGGVRVLCPPR